MCGWAGLHIFPEACAHTDWAIVFSATLTHTSVLNHTHTLTTPPIKRLHSFVIFAHANSLWIFPLLISFTGHVIVLFSLSSQGKLRDGIHSFCADRLLWDSGTHMRDSGRRRVVVSHAPITTWFHFSGSLWSALLPQSWPWSSDGWYGITHPAVWATPFYIIIIISSFTTTE